MPPITFARRPLPVSAVSLVCKDLRDLPVTSDRCLGDLIGSEYREKINRLQKEFARAKKSFDRSVQLEIFVAVDGIGQYISYD